MTPMYKLYGTKMTGTCAVHAALEEIGVAYELIEVSTKKGQHLGDDYRRINPRQQVPALGLPEGGIVTEGPAILMHLADAHPEAALLPAAGTVERAEVTRWLFFFAVNVYEGELRKLLGSRYTTEPTGGAGVQAAANDYVKRHYRIFEEQLEAGPFFLGSRFGILDIYVWMLAQWMERSWLDANCPNILMLADAVKVRPRIAPIHELNFG